MEIKINNTILEFDPFELDNAKKFQKEVNKIITLCNSLKDENDYVKSIKVQCSAIFSFIDNIFGEGKHLDIFGDSVNLKTCLKVFHQIMSSIRTEQEDLHQLVE